MEEHGNGKGKVCLLASITFSISFCAGHDSYIEFTCYLHVIYKGLDLHVICMIHPSNLHEIYTQKHCEFLLNISMLFTCFVQL